MKNSVPAAAFAALLWLTAPSIQAADEPKPPAE
jgi:hypothetical protein